jgi:hypothetical protein
MHEGKIEWNDREKELYELALKVSGAVQAARWTRLGDGTGFVYSFNGAHSLFVDTLRSCRSLAVAHQLGHALMGEQDERISLLRRLVEHAQNTALYNVYYGEDRDGYDVAGRTAHEAVFNVASGEFRCPNSQQGYSPFSTWTRGLAWAICGYAEQLEFLREVGDKALELEIYFRGKHQSRDLARVMKRLRRLAATAAMSPEEIRYWMTRAATVTADFYIAHCCADGIPMWDTGAPNHHRLPANYLDKPADPFNKWEPVDSSAAAIYREAGLAIARTLLDEPYLSKNATHQGLLLHSVYHRPNGWDYIAPGQKVPNGESSMWGDYHLRELALMLLRKARGEQYLTFFSCVPQTKSSP